MFIKVVENSSWDFGDELSSQVKISSRGLIGMDKRAFVKRASAELIDKIDSMNFKPGEVPVHLIAVGATESYGPNRNGDGFSKKACKAFHPCFVKDAHVYRNHKNTDPEQSYGIVKASAYNDEMERIELIVALNSTKEAAAANHGLVADKEMDKLNSDKDFSVSMACTPDKNMPVLTLEQGYIGIGEVRVGMHVLTKEGAWQTVTELKQREYSGPIYEFKIKELPITLRFTSEHPLWAREDVEYSWITAETIGQHFELAYMPVFPNALDKKVEQKIMSKLSTGREAMLFTPRIATFLQARDYCLTHGMAFKSWTQYDKDTLMYGIAIDLDRTAIKPEFGIYPATIKSIVQKPFTGTVYNLEVEDDHCYSAAGIISHNCKVPYDVCSCCGNRAATRSQYCRDTEDGGHCKAGGLLHNMGKTASVNGHIHQLFADNTQPFFFDISHVFVPADRIAYTTGMVKRSSFGIVSGAELAEMYGMYSSNVKQAGFHYMPSDYQDAVQHLCNAVAGFHSGLLWRKQASYGGVIDNTPLTQINIPSEYSTGQVTAALNATNRCLTPTQFLQLSTGAPFKKAAAIAEVIAPLSNEEFSSILVSSNGFNPYIYDKPAPEALKNWSMSQKCASWDRESRTKQAMYTSVNNAPKGQFDPQLVYTLQDDYNARQLANQYALYKVAFMVSVPKEARPAIAELLVGRDYVSF